MLGAELEFGGRLRGLVVFSRGFPGFVRILSGLSVEAEK